MQNRKKGFVIMFLCMLVVCIVTIVAIFCYNNNKINDEIVVQSDYWIATHYFADACPLNMWDSEFENLDSDIKRMKSDGFNCTVLLIPWREFQPDLENGSVELNNDALNKLTKIMEVAQQNDFGVILRMGYFWDYYNNGATSELDERYEKLIYEQEVREAWLAFCRQIYEHTSQYDSLWGGFICWEDFWRVVGVAKAVGGNSQESMEYAKKIGYSDYVYDTYGINEISDMLGVDISKKEDIYIPSIDDAAFSSFYEYYDVSLNNLLEVTQDVFPGISMEVRVDDDLVKNENGENQYYSHKATYSCGDADYTTIVYGIPMGFQNQGEEVTWQDALEMTNNILNKVSTNTKNKKLFVDQFLFYDNTRAFSHNAKIFKDEIDDYLLNCSEVLLNYSMGYGIWTYQNYYFDAIANGKFAKELQAWDVKGDVEIKNDGVSNKCFLGENSQITQHVITRFSVVGEKVTCSFWVSPLNDNANISVSLNDVNKQIKVDKEGYYSVEFSEDVWEKLTISTDAPVSIDNVTLYEFEQEGLLYNPKSEEGECIDAVRKMNRSISEKYIEKKKKMPIFDFIQNFNETKVDNLQASDDYPWGQNVAVISDETEKVLFISPDTSVECDVTLDEKPRSLYIDYSLHDTAASWNISDGAELRVVIKNQQGMMVEDIQLPRVNKDGKSQKEVIDLGDYVKQNLKVTVYCYEIKDGSKDADWIIFHNAYID